MAIADASPLGAQRRQGPVGRLPAAAQPRAVLLLAPPRAVPGGQGLQRRREERRPDGRGARTPCSLRAPPRVGSAPLSAPRRARCSASSRCCAKSSATVPASRCAPPPPRCASSGRRRSKCCPQVSQFFGGGFAECKIIFVCDVIRLCRSKHQALWKRQRDARLKVATEGYRPNARLQAKPSPRPAPEKKPSPGRRAAKQSRPRRAARPAPSAAQPPAAPAPVTRDQFRATFGLEYALGEEPEAGPLPAPLLSSGSNPGGDAMAPTAAELMFMHSEAFDPGIGSSERAAATAPSLAQAPSASAEVLWEDRPASAPGLGSSEVPPTAEPPAPTPSATLGEQVIDRDELQGVLGDFASQVQQMMSEMDSRLGLFEMRVEGSLSELQAKVTLLEAAHKRLNHERVRSHCSLASCVPPLRSAYSNGLTSCLDLHLRRNRRPRPKRQLLCLPSLRLPRRSRSLPRRPKCPRHEGPPSPAQKQAQLPSTRSGDGHRLTPRRWTLWRRLRLASRKPENF